ncbi:pentapeptide repeat-containing protein [Streptomyces sp. NPDC005480]|uniref:pentapeptide repeat-containing protein n=1 Tax=Streptomyces sp. NPDC005480 TaxID=3154880 RepID=UPI0033BDFE9A
MRFNDATFSGGWVDFTEAQFSGGSVNFNSATFSGGAVDFTQATGRAPSGVILLPLPAGLTVPSAWLSTVLWQHLGNWGRYQPVSSPYAGARTARAPPYGTDLLLVHGR